ncbi:MAG: hypothetical protein N2594_08315 [Clostridiales bacterium]|nr:hypothetical protein [Clostridiales bacterium]
MDGGIEMIEKIHGKHYLICDCCGDEFEFDSYDKAIQFKRENDWKSRKYNGEWEDICDYCMEEIGE